MKPPSDRKLLAYIYNRYVDEFSAYSKQDPSRESKILIPIDIPAIAQKFKVDNDIIFGRLYYHLQKKFGYTGASGAQVVFFTPIAGKDRNCINLPLLSAALAGMEEEHARHASSVGLSIASLILSLVALAVSVFVDLR